MATHESGINYRNLIRDLADMYPQDVAEVVVIELVANSLDAGADRIDIDYDEQQKILVVKDNGKGMSSSDFEQYHDFAAGLKKRGGGIGFAGVGAKISFNIAQKVVTETRGETFSGGSNWFLESKKRLVWEDITPRHVRKHGTRVEVRFNREAKLPFTSSEELQNLIYRHYLPIVVNSFLDLYDRMDCYSKKVRFRINQKTITPIDLISAFKLEKTRVFFPKKRGKRIGYGIFGLSPEEYPLGTDVAGVLLSTWGKVIKPELFNQFPSGLGPRIFGLVEIPEFVKYLTTSKTDFIRRGKHKQLEALYGPIREEFKNWLAELGVQQVVHDDTDEASKLEREIKKILDDVPELGEFFGFRTPKNVLGMSNEGSVDASFQDSLQATFPQGVGKAGDGDSPPDEGEEDGLALIADDNTGTTKATPISRSSKRGPKIAFMKAPEKEELAWVEGNAIVINSAHPCYERIQTNALGKKLHNFYAIATAVQRFLGSADDNWDFLFIDKMMSAWGKK